MPVLGAFIQQPLFSLNAAIPPCYAVPCAWFCFSFPLPTGMEGSLRIYRGNPQANGKSFSVHIFTPRGRRSADGRSSREAMQLPLTLLFTGWVALNHCLVVRHSASSPQGIAPVLCYFCPGGRVPIDGIHIRGSMHSCSGQAWLPEVSLAPLRKAPALSLQTAGFLKPL